DKLTVGFETNCVPDLAVLLEDARQEHFDFVCVPLVHPRFSRDARGVSETRSTPLTRSDLLLDSKQWGSLVVGKISEWIDLDSPCADTRRSSEVAFKQEMAWVSHLALAAVMLPTPRPGAGANYSRCLNQVAQELGYVQAWVRIPTVWPQSEQVSCDDGSGVLHVINAGAGTAGGGEGIKPAGAVLEDPWETWSRIRTLCEHLACLNVVLELTSDLPSEAALARWDGEQVRAVIVRTNIFLTNKKGYPTLSRRHQDLVMWLMRFKLQFVVKGRPRHPKGYLPYLQYLDHLRTRRQVTPPLHERETFEAPYLDFLQSPLQPLMDNLESQTYEVFEKDPVKYSQYQLAITAALLDTPEDKASGGVTLLMVVGAGRGPLVRAALNASREANRQLRIVAVEKNANAVITLRNLAITECWTNVTIVASDMRCWDAPEKANILVSELLGSWGDNELSPECLDGAQAYLKPGGISIPYEYTSFVAPMSSHKLWRAVESMGEVKRMETTYVVKLHNFCQMAKEQPCFIFEHPNVPLPGTGGIDNRRYVTLSFDVQQSFTLHGFAGYFSAKLYKDIDISIVPSTFSEGMFSWFPLYIPIRQPVQLRAGETLEAHFWRCCSDKKV
ncbi:arginine-N-methyltransferase, partial [Tribonema minus]